MGGWLKRCGVPKPTTRPVPTAFIHSALSVPDEILAFKREWGHRCPVVIVPTKYHSTPTDVFSPTWFFHGDLGQSHAARCGFDYAKTARALKQSENLLSIEDKVALVSEIFRLQNAAELLEAEERYLLAGR